MTTAKVITRGNCMMCGKELTEGLFFCRECEAKMKAKEIIEAKLYDQAVMLMDDSIREELHSDLAPCTDEEFLAAYMAAHKAKYGCDFIVE